MKVAVIGLGKIGLPLAVQVAGAGHAVTGADISYGVVNDVLAGRTGRTLEPGLAERLADVLAAGRLHATTSTEEAVAASEVVLVVVPLVVGPEQRPDFGALDTATERIGRALRADTLVSYETTLPVHTTRGRFVPALERSSGFILGRDLFVCHSPERVSSGSVFADLRRYPKLVGGADLESGRRAVDFYRLALDFEARPDLTRPNGVWDVGSAEAAEFTKLAETTYRDVNIALANEFARFADRAGVDMGVVIEAANSQPYSHLHRPGVAVGGHCIPVYPHFYLAGDPDARLPRAARAINSDMPRYVVDRLEAALGGLRGRAVVILGAAYRAGVKEIAFSGVFPLAEALNERGAMATVHDPLFEPAELRALGLVPFVGGTSSEAAILQADHDAYTAHDPVMFPGVTLLFDGRGRADPAQWPGVTILGIGRLSRSETRRESSP
ncbi:MAG: nucleotide sugar dehydrogenase [Actinomycetota bacterium]|nr:nucleotide sugar dehydrogenase [Actinomycetota bacterium]